MRDGKVLLHEAVGWADKERNVPMARDSIHPIASSTKLVTTVAALRLFEQNRLRVMAPVASYLPELANLRVARRDASGNATAELVTATRQPTVHDLMTHRAGFTYFFFPKNALRDRYRELGIDRIDIDAAPEMLRKLATLPLAFEPGTSFEYSIATDLLGHIVERVTGKPLDQALNELVLQPLKMQRHHVPCAAAQRCRGWRGRAPSDPDKWVFEWLDVTKPPKRFSGGAGIASTAGDYARLLQMVLNEGELDGVRLLSPATVRWAMSDQIGPMRGVAHPGDGYSWNLFNPVRTAHGGAAVPRQRGRHLLGRHHRPALLRRPAAAPGRRVLHAAAVGARRGARGISRGGVWRAEVAARRRFTQLYVARVARACSMLRCSALSFYGRKANNAETPWA